MRKLIRIFIFILLGIAVAIILGFMFFNLYYDLGNYRAKKNLKEINTLIENGFTYRDLNKNGHLDPYEDSRLSVEERVNNLLKQMNLEEKVGLMWHPPIGVGSQGEVVGKPSIKTMSFNSSYDILINKKISPCLIKYKK